MTKNEAPNQDCAKNKSRGYKHTLEQLSTVLTFRVINKMTDNPFKIQSVAKIAFTRRSGTVIELFGRQKT
jgi:hypothetical protein